MMFAVLAQLAEFERATLIERIHAGLAAARKRGTHLGRRFRLTPYQPREAWRMRSDEGKTYAQIAALFPVPRIAVGGVAHGQWCRPAAGRSRMAPQGRTGTLFPACAAADLRRRHPGMSATVLDGAWDLPPAADERSGLTP